MTEWTISRRAWAPRAKARRRELDFHVIPFATSSTCGSALIEPLNSLLPQTTWRILCHMRHEVRMLWHKTRISNMWIISWRRATHFYMWKSYRSILSVLEQYRNKSRTVKKHFNKRQKLCSCMFWDIWTLWCISISIMHNTSWAASIMSNINANYNFQ